MYVLDLLYWTHYWNQTALASVVFNANYRWVKSERVLSAIV